MNREYNPTKPTLHAFFAMTAALAVAGLFSLLVGLSGQLDDAYARASGGSVTVVVHHADTAAGDNGKAARL